MFGVAATRACALDLFALGAYLVVGLMVAKVDKKSTALFLFAALLVLATGFIDCTFSWSMLSTMPSETALVVFEGAMDLVHDLVVGGLVLAAIVRLARRADALRNRAPTEF